MKLSRNQRHRINTIAVLVAAAFAVVMFAKELLFGSGVVGLPDTSPGGWYARKVGFGLAAVVGVMIAFLYFRKSDRLLRAVLLLSTIGVGIIFDPRAFEHAIPQGIWIPFILALALTTLPWALTVLAATIVVALVAYPLAFQPAFTFATSLIIASLLVLDRLVKQNLVNDLVEANRHLLDSKSSLHESEQRYRQLSEQSPVPIVVFSPEGYVLRVNKAWEKLWGTTFENARRYNVFEDQQVIQAGIPPLLHRILAGEKVDLPLIAYDFSRNPNARLYQGKCWIRAVAFAVFGEDCKPLEVVVLQEDITERVKAEDQIRHLAYFDPLTQLANRRLLMDRLEHAMASSARTLRFGAVLMLDLDHFKALNDTQGHDIGDQLLIEVARRLSNVVREGDTVSRLGGDEYVVVLEELTTEEELAATQAERVAEKVHEAIRQPYRLKHDTMEYRCSTSVGVVLYRGKDLSPEALLKQADIALYQAKGSGRNAIRFYNPEMQAAIDARMEVEQALNGALERGEFELHYQPQVNRSGALIGAEALLRWRSEKLGNVPPNRFIPLLEDNWQILQVGQWVIETACRQLAQWATEPATAGLQLAVNVSARQFQHRDFVEQVRSALKSNGVEPSRLKLELTESVVLNDVDLIVDKMREIDALGVCFSMDDFGTGYSSLSYLKRLPLEQLKIDRSFVRDVLSDPNDAAIARTIVALGTSLGLQVIAEGVETEAQRQFLEDQSCHVWQGYLLSPPVPVRSFEALVREAAPLQRPPALSPACLTQPAQHRPEVVECTDASTGPEVPSNHS